MSEIEKLMLESLPLSFKDFENDPKWSRFSQDEINAAATSLDAQRLVITGMESDGRVGWTYSFLMPAA